MNKRRNKSQDNKKKSNKIIRCSSKMIPVFESDTCEDFIKRINSESNNICKNCEKSF
jgi:hypothetical protein